MLNLICNLVRKCTPASRSTTPVLPVVTTSTTLEVRIYCGYHLEWSPMNSTHDVSTTVFSQAGSKQVRTNVERELNRFYRQRKEDKSREAHFRIAFLSRMGIENAEQFAVQCEQLARELAASYGLVVRTVLTISRR